MVPKVNTNLLKNCIKGLLYSIEKRLIDSCHDISEGGIGVCLSEMALGGNIGAEIDISNINKRLRDDFILFSESNTRWILEIKNQNCNKIEDILIKFEIPFIKIGKTFGKELIIKNNEKVILNSNINDLREIWKKSLSNIMG